MNFSYYVYVIYNTANNKMYFGFTNNVHKRWARHKKDIKDHTHHNEHLQRAWELYGPENFKFRIISGLYTENQALSLETIYINLYKSTGRLYNMAPGGIGGDRGIEARKKISQAKLGQHHTEGSKQKMSEGQIRVAKRGNEHRNSIVSIKHLAFGEYKTARKWSEDARCIVTHSLIKNRIKLGWPMEKSITTPNLIDLLQKYKAFGEEKTLVEWIKDPRCNISVEGFRKRLKSKRYSIEEIISNPRTDTAIRHRAFGEEKTKREWVQDFRCIVSYSVLNDRLKRKWDVEKSLTTPTINRR